MTKLLFCQQIFGYIHLLKTILKITNGLQKQSIYATFKIILNNKQT